MNDKQSRRQFLGTAAALVASGFVAGCRKNGSPDVPSPPPRPVALPKGDGLAKPVPVEVDGEPLVRDCSYLDQFLYPFVGDFDGDGRPDLLLGTREDGRLLVYRNVGAKGKPRLSPPQWFDDLVPNGRIPAG
jgi:hypothetical protein